MFDNFEVTIIRSARRKTVAIKVDLSGVSVRAPENLPQDRIRELIVKKAIGLSENAKLPSKSVRP